MVSLFHRATIITVTKITLGHFTYSYIFDFLRAEANGHNKQYGLTDRQQRQMLYCTPLELSVDRKNCSDRIGKILRGGMAQIYELKTRQHQYVNQ